MRCFFNYGLLLFSCLLLACNNDSLRTTDIQADSSFTDTINYAVNKDSLLLATNTIKPPEGIYQGVLPCDGCKGLEQTVYFNPDLTYRLQEVKLGKKGEVPFAVSGTWKPSEGIIWLYKEGVVQARYTWQRDTLVYMDAKTGKRYPMRKLTSAKENDVWHAKGAAGLEFYGVGNEPFWNVEVDEQKSIAFHLAEWSKPQQFKAVAPQATPDSTLYITSNDSVLLRVVIYNTFCSDGMSDFVYAQSVKVLYNGQVYRGCGIKY